jgi:hypothetical protein
VAAAESIGCLAARVSAHLRPIDGYPSPSTACALKLAPLMRALRQMVQMAPQSIDTA